MKQKFAYLKQGAEFVVNHKIYTKIDERHGIDKYGTIVSFNTRDTVETDLSLAKQFVKKKPKLEVFEDAPKPEFNFRSDPSFSQPVSG